MRKIIGERIDKPVFDEREHFLQCKVCMAWMDMRDLGQVLQHPKGPHPPPEDAPDPPGTQ